MQRRGDAAQNFFDRRLGIIGDNKNEQPFAAKIDLIPLTKLQLIATHASFEARNEPVGTSR
jgi:hypothetical protein